MATETTFRKQFLFRDQERLDASIQDFKSSLSVWSNALTKVVPYIAEILKRDLTEDEIQGIIDNKGEAVKQLVRPLYQFPNADDAFNLQALGINLHPALSVLENLNPIDCEYDLNGLTLEITEDFVSAQIEYNTKYTENEKQNEALKHAKIIADSLNKLQELNILNEYSFVGAGKGMNFVKVVPDGFGRKYIPNHYYIEDIRD